MAAFIAEAPRCTIDFDRRFSLPFAMPPDMPAAGLTSYFSGLGLALGIIRHAWNEDGTAQDRNPEHVNKRKVRTLPLAAGGHTLIPTSTTPVPVIAAKTAVEQLTKAAVADLGAASFRWENPATNNTGSLAMPIFTDESLVLHWPQGLGTPVGSILSSPLEGVLTSDAAQYLLATPAATRDGELHKSLLRAPAPALVRFDRYRHITRATSGKLEESYPSAAGALVVQKLPTGLVPDEPASHLHNQRTLVFENVDILSAEECLSSLVLLQLQRLGALLARPDKRSFETPVLAQLNFLFKAWLSYLKLNPPATALADINDELLKPFRLAKPAVAKHVKALATAVLTTAVARQGLISFIQTRYVPVLCGRSWAELGAPLPVEAALSADDRKARRTLVDLVKSASTWLYCYAGCPIGRPSKIYVETPGAPPLPRVLIESALTTFELEALVIAGDSASQFSGISPPALPANTDMPIDLSAFDAKADGICCVFRAVDAGDGRQECTTFEWLLELVMGANRDAEIDARIDFWEFVTLGHPLVNFIPWTMFGDAVAARMALDTLDATSVGAVKLAAALVAWWAARSGMDEGGFWPAQGPALSTVPGLITPAAPYLSGESRAGLPSGFDVHDLLAAMQARTLVLDGKDPTHTVNLALGLALMDREGYRDGAYNNRVGSHPSGMKGWIHFRNMVRIGPGPMDFRHVVVGDFGGDPSFDGMARVDWALYPYGLDVFNARMPDFTDTLRQSRASFVAQFKDLEAAGVITTPFDAGSAHAFVINRLRGRARSPLFEIECQRSSRQLQWFAITCQQAEFQRRHNILCYGTGTKFLNGQWLLKDVGESLEPVDEFVSATLPPIGASADSLERRDFIAYYALLYLAFNVQPQTWNEWVRAAKVRMGPTDKVSRYLTYCTNTATRGAEPNPPAPVHRKDYQRANMLRFALALDAYLRMSLDPAELTDPSAGRGAW